MTYDLILISKDDHHLPVLQAQFHCPPEGQARVLSAFIDQDERGQLTTHGTNAFRCFALSEIMIANALSPSALNSQPSTNHAPL